MNVTRVYFDGDCYTRLRAEFSPVNGNKLDLWTPEYLDHLFLPFVERGGSVPLAVECSDGHTCRLVDARIDFHADMLSNGEYQMEVSYDHLEPVRGSLPSCGTI